MSAMGSQITSVSIVYSTVYSGADHRKHQSSASLAFVRGIHRGPVNSPHKGPVTRKMFSFDDVIMQQPPTVQMWYDSPGGVRSSLLQYSHNLTGPVRVRTRVDDDWSASTSLCYRRSTQVLPLPSCTDIKNSCFYDMMQLTDHIWIVANYNW